MSHQLFTAARAAQHRSELMDAARDARRCRRVGNRRGLRLWTWRRPTSTARPVTAPVRPANAL